MTAVLQHVPMRRRAPPTPFARGWYAVAAADEIDSQTLKPLYWLDQELIAYRTASGAAQVADAYCPHLGAHLASHDGAIADGHITCPFHKWRWDGESGRCSHIPYASALPPGTVKLTLHPTREIDGQVLMWFDPQGKPPDFEPFASPAFARDRWVKYDQRSFTTTCPFPDILENLFDGAHIVQLHHAAKMPQLTNMGDRPHGMYLEYAIDADAEDQPLEQLAMNLTGISLLNQHYVARGWEALFFIALTPIDTERTVQSMTLYLKDLGSSEAHDALGGPFVERFVYEVEQDLKVLDYKKHLPTPRLCRGDGPIYQYREYAAKYL
jgi:phenylpropionate dioxygenase-like ring-hydroxylating dioxygenase large terminal subunit